MKSVLIAGATGTLGSRLTAHMKGRGYRLKILVRKPEQAQLFTDFITQQDEIVLGQATDRDSITGIAHGVDAVFSAVGITRQKDGLTYDDVDYGANRNLLNEALRAKVPHFVYIASLNGEKMKHLKMIKAKERFVSALKEADIGHTVIRPNGFFSDLKEILRMAQNGRVYLLGDGLWKANPIATNDLAPIVLDLYEKKVPEAEVGGPEVLSQRKIAELAFKALGKKAVITGLPTGLASTAAKLMRLFTPISVYGPLEFFVEAASRDMIATKYGSSTLEIFFNSIVHKNNKP